MHRHVFRQKVVAVAAAAVVVTMAGFGNRWKCWLTVA